MKLGEIHNFCVYEMVVDSITWMSISWKYELTNLYNVVTDVIVTLRTLHNKATNLISALSVQLEFQVFV